MENNIFIKVQEAISDSCGIEKEEIKGHSSLFNDLNIDSIDMVDILYTLESEYDIELKVSDINKEAIQELGDEPFEIDNIITEKGLQALKRKIPDIPKEGLQYGISVHEVIRMISVKMLCNMVEIKLLEKTEST